MDPLAGLRALILFPTSFSTPAIMTEISADQVTHDTPPLNEGGTSFGSFYPKNYVLAVFLNDPDADTAGHALETAGFASDDIIVASGADVADHDDAVQSQQGIFAKLGEKWSRLYTDEAAKADTLMAMARDGAAFVLAYAPEDDDAERAANTLKAFNPKVLRKYGTLAITEM